MSEKTWRAYHNLIENKQKKMRRNTWNKCRTNEIHQGAEINKKNIYQTMQLKREVSASSFAVRPSLDHDR